MKRITFSRILVLLAVLLAVLAATAWPYRRLLTLRIVGLVEEPVTLNEPLPESESVTWFDDYFTLESIDSQMIAIGEPRSRPKPRNLIRLRAWPTGYQARRCITDDSACHSRFVSLSLRARGQPYKV